MSSITNVERCLYQPDTLELIMEKLDAKSQNKLVQVSRGIYQIDKLLKEQYPNMYASKNLFEKVFKKRENTLVFSNVDAMQMDIFEGTFKKKSILENLEERGEIKFITKSPNCTTFALELFFKFTAENGYNEIVKGLISCDRFAEISPAALNRALIHAANKGRERVVQQFISCSRFHEIDSSHLHIAFSIAIKKGHDKIVQQLRSCSRFPEIQSLIDQRF